MRFALMISGLALLAACGVPSRVDTPPVVAQVVTRSISPVASDVLTARSYYNIYDDRIWVEERPGAVCVAENRQQRVEFTTPANVALASFGPIPATDGLDLSCTYDGETVTRYIPCFVSGGLDPNCRFGGGIDVTFNAPPRE